MSQSNIKNFLELNDIFQSNESHFNILYYTKNIIYRLQHIHKIDDLNKSQKFDTFNRFQSFKRHMRIM